MNAEVAEAYEHCSLTKFIFESGRAAILQLCLTQNRPRRKRIPKSLSPDHYPLQDSSPAIDAADDDHCTYTDQASNERPDDGDCDIGAIEAPAADPTPTDTDTPTPTDTATFTPKPRAQNQGGDIRPSNLLATNTDEGVLLTWTAPEDPVDGYQILRRLDSSDSSDYEVVVEDTGNTNTTYLDTNTLAISYTLFYAVKAIADGDTAPQSGGAAIVVEAVDTDTPTATATATPTATPNPNCINVGPDTYWLFPARKFLSGSITVYDNSDCHRGAADSQQDLGSAGYVYSADGQAAAAALCTTAHDGTTHAAQQQVFNTDLWACTVQPTATPTPLPTKTPAPSATPQPTNTPQSVGNRDISNLQLSSNQAGALSVSWNPPSETPHDYRINWAETGESFPSWRENDGNAYPASASYTITGLDHGVQYKVRVRALQRLVRPMD